MVVLRGERENKQIQLMLSVLSSLWIAFSHSKLRCIRYPKLLICPEINTVNQGVAINLF